MAKRQRISLSPNPDKEKHRWFEDWYNQLPDKDKTDAVIDAVYDYKNGYQMVTIPIGTTLAPDMFQNTDLAKTQLQPVETTCWEVADDDIDLLDELFS